VPRGISNSLITLLSGETRYRMANAVYLDVGSGLRSTDYGNDITLGSDTYSPSSYLLEVGDPNESRDLRVNNLTVQFSGVGDIYKSAFLNNNWINRTALIYRAFFDEDTNILVNYFTIFNGLITGWEYRESSGSAEFSVQLASHWADFQKPAGRKTNNNSQQFYFTNDVGFEYAASLVRDLKWGKK
tara:strand:+ start:490 stop:1047 length:558 start_codon:yes stop_codon:yes gene_type:complete